MPQKRDKSLRDVPAVLWAAGVPRLHREALATPDVTEPLLCAKEWHRRHVEEQSGPWMLVALGERGTGKTVGACYAMGLALQWRDAIDRPGGGEHNARGAFVPAGELARCWRDGAWFARLERVSVLLLDDIGKEQDERVKSAIFELLDKRHAGRRVTLATSNLSAADFAVRYGEALADRMRVGAVVEEFFGESLRGKQARK